MGIKDDQDEKGFKVCVLFGIFSLKKKEKRSYMIYEGVLCIRGSKFVLCFCRKLYCRLIGRCLRWQISFECQNQFFNFQILFCVKGWRIVRGGVQVEIVRLFVRELVIGGLCMGVVFSFFYILRVCDFINQEKFVYFILFCR